MKKLICILSFNLLMVSTALAYKDGTYPCKNRGGLPDNVYKITTAEVGGLSLPAVELTRYYKEDFSNPNAPVVESHIRGIATVISSGDYEILQLLQISLEFKNDQFMSCQ